MPQTVTPSITFHVLCLSYIVLHWASSFYTNFRFQHCCVLDLGFTRKFRLFRVKICWFFPLLIDKNRFQSQVFFYFSENVPQILGLSSSKLETNSLSTNICQTWVVSILHSAAKYHFKKCGKSVLLRWFTAIWISTNLIGAGAHHSQLTLSTVCSSCVSVCCIQLQLIECVVGVRIIVTSLRILLFLQFSWPIEWDTA